MKFLLLLLAFPMISTGQTGIHETSDSLTVNGFRFLTYVLKLSNYSSTDPAMMLVVPERTVDSVKLQIPKVYASRKQEYNEFYLLGVPAPADTAIVERALTEFIARIDSARMARKRSTFMKVYAWDNSTQTINYLTRSKDLSTVSNLYFLNSMKDLCKYMICPGR